MICFEFSLMRICAWETFVHELTMSCLLSSHISPQTAVWKTWVPALLARLFSSLLKGDLSMVLLEESIKSSVTIKFEVWYQRNNCHQKQRGQDGFFLIFFSFSKKLLFVSYFFQTCIWDSEYQQYINQFKYKWNIRILKGQ